MSKLQRQGTPPLYLLSVVHLRLSLFGFTDVIKRIKLQVCSITTPITNLLSTRLENNCWTKSIHYLWRGLHSFLNKNANYCVKPQMKHSFYLFWIPPQFPCHFSYKNLLPLNFTSFYIALLLCLLNLSSSSSLEWGFSHKTFNQVSFCAKYKWVNTFFQISLSPQWQEPQSKFT